MNNKQSFIWSVLSLFRKTILVLPHTTAVMLGGCVGALIPLFTHKKKAEISFRPIGKLLIKKYYFTRIIFFVSLKACVFIL